MNNQLNFLRFFAAFLVLYGHGYVLYGLTPNTILSHTLGLAMFFSISGYLISYSWDRDPSFKRYFARRSLRIFPALIIMLLITTLLLGPIVTTLPISEYFSSSITWYYILNNSFLHIQYYLPGVFENAHVKNAMNGSLWSLPVEFFCYILVAAIGFIFRKKAKYLALLLLIITIILTLAWDHLFKSQIVFYYTDVHSAVIVSCFFWMGATLHHFKLNKLFSFEGFVIGLLIIIFMYQFNNNILNEILKIIILPYLVLAFGFSNANKLSIFNKADYSYGIYIYAFPIQQSIIYIFPNLSFTMYMITSAFCTLAMSVFSWHCIEKHILKYKPK
ncbi:acyltransferase family protein [Francisella sp. XLW-1]|uniref:acyltransferase family protein n=1 Tax=Francisella sp. XLW-1 TaxID=2610887 RepID=UPI00123DB472|nr:acyltransferase [Francisella sp. XLW-1]